MGASPFVVLPSSHARARDQFAGSDELETELRNKVRGEVRFDPASKALYATDASNYRHIPIGLVIPRDVDDVITTVAVCRTFNAPILPRGAGTSLAGQGCNFAVILDFSKCVNEISAVDPVARTVYVQPGAVLDRVRDAAEEFHLTFAPDPATHSRCTIGGMIGNNSCGVHALMGGKTVDNILSLDVLLYDGTRMTVGPTSPSELAQKIAEGGRTGEIYSTLKQLSVDYADQVRRRFPKIARRVSGYNLDELLPETNFNVARTLVGSEGTCVIVLGATLQLVQSPQFRALVGAGFADVFLGADNVPLVLEHKPIGLEGIDGVLLDAMRRKQQSTADLSLFPSGEGFLIVEFGGATQAEADQKAQALAAALALLPEPPSVRVYTSGEAKRVWNIRESSLAATAFVPGKGTGWEGWDDSAVDPTRLGSYLRAIHALMEEFHYTSSMYGHFGEGCVHMRHNFDLQSEAGILAFRRFIERAAEITLAHGGSISGEHGDGQARGALLPKMFGRELMEAFRVFKRAWDPTNNMNPGKLIDAREAHEDLRLGADYKPLEPKLHFALLEDNSSFASANLRCVGMGTCRKTDAGTMCPSFMATGEEQHSTRGRAHLLWELMQGEILQGQWKNTQVKEALDLCLSCKACKSECPVSIDMATYKSEFLSHHYEDATRPLFHHAFGRIDVWARIAGFAPEMANVITSSSIVSKAMKRLLHIHSHRTFPRFAKPFVRNVLPQSTGTKEVFLWADTFNNYFHPSTMQAAYQVLRDAGFRVLLPSQHLCCGRPLYDFGMIDTAKKYLLKVLEVLSPQLEKDTPIIVLEPSCASVFRDELTNLFPYDARAHMLRDQALLLSEFLRQRAPHYKPPQFDGKFIVHGHCHQRATKGMDDEIALLRSTGARVQLLDSGCCGMAGPYGFEKDKFDVSQKLAERVLLPAVRNASNKDVIVSDGFSCCEQVVQNGGVRPLHLAEILAQSSDTFNQH